MLPTVRIVSRIADAPVSGDHESGAGSKRLVAGIDTGIFEGDSHELGGERFWEAYWSTQHTYGAISEGQSLAAMLAAQPDRLIDKLHADVSQLRQHPKTMRDDDKNDVLGMMMFLFSLERRTPGYNPFQELGVDRVLDDFSAAVSVERQQRGLDA